MTLYTFFVWENEKDDAPLCSGYTDNPDEAILIGGVLVKKGVFLKKFTVWCAFPFTIEGIERISVKDLSVTET